MKCKYLELCSWKTDFRRDRRYALLGPPADPHHGRLSRGSLLLAGCALLLSLSAISQSAYSQDNPFAEPEIVTETPDESIEATAEETNGASEEDEGEEGASKLDELLADEEDSLVRAIVESRPTTAQQWMRDVQALLNLDRFEFAKEYLQQWLAAEPGQAELVRVYERFGSEFLLRLLNTPEVQPPGAAVAKAVMAAAEERIQDMDRLAALVEQLSVPESARRRAALVELLDAGPVAAVPLIAALADEARNDEHAAVRKALVAMDKEAEEPLIAALNSDDESLRFQVITTLHALESKQAIPSLLPAALVPDQRPRAAEAASDMIRDVLGGLPDQQEAVTFLSRRLENFLAGAVPGSIDEDERVTVWIWDTEQELPRQETIAATDASFRSAAQMAKQLHRIAPNKRDYERMYLATGLEVAKRRIGYGRPLTKETGPIYEDAASATADLLQGVLELAFEKHLEGAAIAAVNLLGRTNNPELLLTDTGKTSLLARSLRSPMRRVQFAAAEAVMNIAPERPYPGSSHLTDVLGYFSASCGERRVLIATPRRHRADKLAGFLNELGFVANTEHVGRDAALQAFKSPDYSFLFISDAIDRPAYRELVQILRRDPRTAGLPIGLLVREANTESAEWFAQHDHRTLVMALPQTREDVASDARQLIAAAGRSHVSLEERIEHARFALEALSKLASHPEKHDFYNLFPLEDRIEQALRTSALAVQATEVLGLLGTPAAQQALVDVANTPARPLNERQAAATAFHTAVSRRGVLLSRDQIRHQYETYNASESLDRDTQDVLASILDTIEGPSRMPDAEKN